MPESPLPAATPTPTLSCPSCQAPMRRLQVDGHYGTEVELDLCGECQAFWFDLREHLQLAPDATLKLFEIIQGERAARRQLPGRLECPRCHLRLLATEDRQRATSFRYWRCGRGHGRFITFFDFLREKSFVRALDARQLAELKSQVQSVNCSNCGAPIDLARSSVCSYCRTPLAMLDFGQVGRVVSDLRQQASRPSGLARGSEAALALALARERQQVESLFHRLDRRPDWAVDAAGGGLVESGLDAVVSLLRKLRD
jgi:hypothetical protein